jgi:hypothetical protein
MLLPRHKFDLRSAQGKLIASLMAALAEFERSIPLIKGRLDERGDVPVRQFDIEPLASVIQSDPHGLYCNVQ